MDNVNLADKSATFAEHMPVAETEVQVMLIEPASTLNTGNVRNARTIESPDWI